MKKIFTFIAAVVAAFSFVSCENDDIAITKAVTINVNPATVISPFNSYLDFYGDPMSINLADINNDNAQMIIRIVAYDENGNFIAEDQQVFEGKDCNYTSARKFEMFLGCNDCTILAMSYIRDKSDQEDMWSLKDYQKLSTAVIEDPGYFWGQYKMLGLKVQKVNLAASDASVTVNLEPVCAVVEFGFNNLMYLGYVADIESIGLYADRATERLLLDNSGQYTTQEEANNQWICHYSNPSDRESIWGLTCILPVSMMSVAFFYEGDADGKYVNGALAPERITPKAGDCFAYYMDFSYDEGDNQVVWDGGFVNSSHKAPVSRSKSMIKPSCDSGPVKITTTNRQTEMKVVDFIKK